MSSLLRILAHIWFWFCHHSLYHVFIIAALRWVVDDVLLSLSDLFDFIILVNIFYSIVTCCYCFWWRVHVFGLKTVCILFARCFVVLVVVTLQLSIHCCNDVDLIVVIYIYISHFCRFCMRLVIINWQLVVGVGKVVDIVFSHIVFYCTVFGCYWCSLFLERFNRFHVFGIYLHYPVYAICCLNLYLDRICWPWSM